MAYQSKLHQLSSAGYSLVELLLAMGIFGVMVTALFTGFIATREGRPQQQQRWQAAALYQETVEAMRVIREQGWAFVADNGTFHPQRTADSWELVGGSQTVGNFTRTVEISDVFRDAGGTIVPSGGTLDPSTKAVTITVAWNQPLVSSYSNTIYLSRYLDNLSFIHTTIADFEQEGHQLDNVVIIADPTVEEPDNAFIRLSPMGDGRGNWCEPNPAFVQYDLPGQAHASGIMAFFNEPANRTEVFATTGKNASGNPLSYVQVTADYPPSPSLAGVLSTSPQVKANSVFGIPGYAFITGSNPNKEALIIDLSTMMEVGSFDAPGSVDGESIFVRDGVGYLTQGSNLRIFDATTPTGIKTMISSVSLAGTGTKVMVVGDYAYVSVNSSTNQLQIIDVSDPSSPGTPMNFSVNGLGGRSLYVNESGNRVYLVTGQSASQNELYIIDTQNLASPSLISSVSTGSMNPNAVAVVLNGNRVIVVGEGGNEYQVWSVVNEGSPSLCGSLGSLGGVFDLSTVVQPNGDAYAYITTGQADSELKIIEGGPGGAFSTTGQYESAAFDTGNNTAFNRLSFSGEIPADTTLRFQVSGAPIGATDCSDADYSFVGPDGTSNTFFSTGISALPFSSTPGQYNNPARCFKYRAFFDTTDIMATPRLDEVVVNYSP